MTFDFTDFVLFVFLPPIIFAILFIHEIGHYWAARLFGLEVKNVTIGVGREIWSRKDKYKTRWSLHFYPIWAHVQIEGFEDDTQPTLNRFLTVLAGPFFNLILPFFLFFGFYLAIGQPSTLPVLTGIEIGDVADRAGFKVGDKVVEVDGISVARYKDIHKYGYDHERHHVYTIDRNDEIIRLKIKPDFIEFQDIDGIDRAYPRLGVIWRHKPYKFEAVKRINDVDVTDDNEKIRSLITQNEGKDAVLSLKANDGSVRDYYVHFYQGSNPPVYDPDHDDYEHLFLGQKKDDFYYTPTFNDSLLEAAVFSKELVAKVAKIPFQLFPIDPKVLSSESSVYSEQTFLANTIYRIIYVTALGSILMGLINLIPLPRLDGSLLLFYAIETMTGEVLPNKQKGMVLGTCFFILYCAVLFANLEKIPGYIDSRAKKVQKLMDTKN